MKIDTPANFYNALELLIDVLNDCLKDSFVEKVKSLIDEYNCAGNDRVQLCFDETFNTYSLEDF